MESRKGGKGFRGFEFPSVRNHGVNGVLCVLVHGQCGKGDEHHPQFGELRIFANLDTFKGSVVETFTTNEG